MGIKGKQYSFITIREEQILLHFLRTTICVAIAEMTGIYLEPECIDILPDKKKGAKLFLHASKFRQLDITKEHLVNCAFRKFERYSYMTTDAGKNKAYKYEDYDRIEGSNI